MHANVLHGPSQQTGPGSHIQIYAIASFHKHLSMLFTSLHWVHVAPRMFSYFLVIFLVLEMCMGFCNFNPGSGVLKYYDLAQRSCSGNLVNLYQFYASTIRSKAAGMSYTNSKHEISQGTLVAEVATRLLIVDGSCRL